MLNLRVSLSHCIVPLVTFFNLFIEIATTEQLCNNQIPDEMKVRADNTTDAHV